MSGVTGVINDISLKATAIAPDVKRRIQEALTRRAQVEANTIRVDVLDGNKVKLEGKVNSWEEREAAADAAWSVAGVQSVDDRLMIV